MNISSLRLLGQTVEIRHSDSSVWSQGGMGRMVQDKNLIELAENLPDDLMLETLLHEVVHWILCTIGHGRNDDEGLVTGFSSVLFETMRSNPQFIKMILNDGDKPVQLDDAARRGHGKILKQQLASSMGDRDRTR